MAEAQESDLQAPDNVRKVVVASFIGTTIEWYDFFLYGTAASLVFGGLFFPADDPSIGTIKAYATFAIGFFARPVGGIVFAHFGDRMGRKSVLVTTLMLMGVATFLIGCLPTYSAIGIWAPILLVLLRFVQGFGVGGEWGGAVLMAVEHGHRGRRGLYASWVQAGVPIGMLLATGTFAAMNLSLSEEAFLAWGWRVPFLFGILLLAVGMFIRLRIMESPLFSKMAAEGNRAAIPVLSAIKQHPKNVLLAMGARFAENACYYVFTIFVLSYAVEWLEIERSMVYPGVLIASTIQFFVIPIFGGLSDRIGRRPLYLAGAGLLLVFPFLFFALVETKSPALIWLAISLGLVIHSLMYAPQAAFFSELFGTNVRYSGASLGYQLAAPFAGGLAPLIAAGLLNWSDGASWPVSVYLAGMAVITIVSVWLAQETHRRELHH